MRRVRTKQLATPGTPVRIRAVVPIFMGERDLLSDFRSAFIAEALSWVGTPFANKGRIKGPAGCVDCANLLAQSAFNVGLVEPFELPDYPPNWGLHRDNEYLLDVIVGRLGMREIPSAEAQPGDIHVYKFGRVFWHSAIRISETEIVHALAGIGLVTVSRIDEPLLTHIPAGKHLIPRPVRYFDLESLTRK